MEYLFFLNKFIIILSLIFISEIASQLAEDSEILQNYRLKYANYTLNLFEDETICHPGNILLSPLSEHIIVALPSSTANEETSKRFLNILDTKDRINQLFTKLTTNLQDYIKHNFSSFNKIYIQTPYAVNDKFKTTAMKAFSNVEIENINFENIEATVNEWVEARTNNEIKDFFTLRYMKVKPVIVLVNTVFFHGEWKTESNKDFTKEEDFYVSLNETVKADMISFSGTFNFYVCTTLRAKVLELPYKGDEISMFLVLPIKINDTGKRHNVSDYLTPPVHLKPTKVDVRIPKFAFERGKFLNTMPATSYTGIFANNETSVGHHGTAQTSSIVVDERGTTVIAVTRDVQISSKDWIAPTSYSPEGCSRFRFHPNYFIFYLRLKRLNISFFVGQYLGRKYN